MGIYIWNRLPSEYQEVEYIQSSGTQYIDTGIKPTNKTLVDTKGYTTAYPLFGVGRAGYYQSLCLATNGNNGYYMGRSRSGSSSNSTVQSSVTFNTTPHTFQISQIDGFYIDGTKIGTFTQYTFTETYSIYLFGWNSYGTFTDGCNGRIYYMKISENGTLVRDFIPCYRKSDSVIGMYDLVNNQFYTNSGTGTFTKGSDVNTYRESSLKNAYIGEVWTPGSNTIAYFPLKDDTNDYSGKGVTLSINGSFTKGTNGYTFASSTSGHYVRTTLANVGYYGMWYKINSVTTTGNSVVGVYEKYGRGGYFPGSDSSVNRGKIRILKNSSYTVAASTDGMSTGQWHHLALAYDGTKFYLGKDGVLSEFYSGEFWNNGDTLVLANVGSGGSINVIISDFIAESSAWTADKYLNYFNQTKSDYGL